MRPELFARTDGRSNGCAILPSALLEPLGDTKKPVDGAGGGGGAGFFRLTCTVANALLPSLVAVIVALPLSAPVTNPLAETVAIVWASVRHVTARPDSVSPSES